MPLYNPPSGGGGSTEHILPGFGTYTSGNWYQPYLNASVATSSFSPVVTSTYLQPFMVNKDVSIDMLGLHVTTGGTNVQLAIYANNPATGKPTGLPLAKTASITASTPGSLNGALLNSAGSSLPTLSLDSDNLYWAAFQSDNTAIRFRALLAGVNFVPAVAGTTVQADTLAGSYSLQVNSGTFGTWADFTSATFVFDASVRAPVIQFRVS